MIDLIFELPDGTQLTETSMSVVPNNGDFFYHEKKKYRIIYKIWRMRQPRLVVYLYTEVA